MATKFNRLMKKYGCVYIDISVARIVQVAKYVTISVTYLINQCVFHHAWQE